MSHYFIVCKKLARELANFVCRNVGITNTEWNGNETYEKTDEQMNPLTYLEP